MPYPTTPLTPLGNSTVQGDREQSLPKPQRNASELHVSERHVESSGVAKQRLCRPWNWQTTMATACLGLWLFSYNGTLHGEEPYQRFLEKLKSEQLFDLALVYLNDLEDEPNVSEDFKAVIALERGMLMYSAAAQMSSQNAQRPVKLDQAEAAIRTFLKNGQQHPRRGEAQLSLGNLLLTRAEESKTKAGADNKKDVPEAIKFYSEAHDLFQGTVKELAAVLEQIKGARTRFWRFQQGGLSRSNPR